MSATTNTIEMINQMTTSTGMILTNALPLLYWFIGGLIAFFAFGMIIKGFKKII